MVLFGRKKDKGGITPAGYGVDATISRADKMEILPAWVRRKMTCCVCGHEYYEMNTSEIPEEDLIRYVPAVVYPCADCGRIYCDKCMRETRRCACKSKQFYVKPMECAEKGRFFNQL
jgi:hypothetical protein